MVQQRVRPIVGVASALAGQVIRTYASAERVVRVGSVGEASALDEAHSQDGDARTELHVNPQGDSTRCLQGMLLLFR